MKHLLLANIVMISWGASFAQITLFIVDRQTQAPVGYASVYFPDLKTGTTADSNGTIIINIRQQKLPVQITAVGYNVLLTTVSTTQSHQTVYLEPSHLELHEVVISAFSQKLQSENAMNVTSLKLNAVQSAQLLSVPEKLAALPGVWQVSTGAGIGKPVIRGLSGSRVAVFAQGVRLENQQWGDEHGLGVDDNGYESVEIIKGPASLLYGSDALGGVVYFVDERYARQNNIEGRVGFQFSSNTLGLKNTASLKISKNNFHWNMFSGYTSHKDYADGSGINVPNSRFSTADLKTAFGLTQKKWTASLRYNYLSENYGLTDIDTSAIAGYTDKRAMDFPYQYLQTHIASMENTIFFRQSKLKIDAGNVFNRRQELEEDGGGVAALDLSLSTATLSVKWYSPSVKDRWHFIAGTQKMFQINGNRGKEILIPDAKTFDIGLFGTATLHFAGQSFAEAGLRWGSRTIGSRQHGMPGDEDYMPAFREHYPSVNFSVGAVHHFKKYFSLRANVASGFRAPNTFELLSDGVHEGTFRYEIGSTALTSEDSYQADVSLSFENEHYAVFVNPFINCISGYIYLQPADSSIAGVPVYYYKQANAVLTGGEGGLHFHPHPVDWLHLEMNYSAVFGSDEHGNALPMIPSQKIHSTLRVDFKMKKALQSVSAYVQHVYSFRQSRIAVYETATTHYHLLHAGAAFGFLFGTQKVLFSAGVSNTLDAVYYDHLSRYKAQAIFNMGRTFFAAVTIPFNSD